MAAEHGYLEVLQYLHEYGCPWYSNACEMAAKHGHLEVIRYLHEHGCPWTSRACTAAAKGGHLAVLRYLHKTGCRLENGPIYRLAVQHRQLEVLWYLKDHGLLPDDSWEIKEAVRKGDLEAIEFLHTSGYKLNLVGEVMSIAVECGRLEVVKYLHERGCPLLEDMCRKAAGSGNLNVLRYLRQHGCGWNIEWCAESAVQHGRLNVLKYICEYVCAQKPARLRSVLKACIRATVPTTETWWYRLFGDCRRPANTVGDRSAMSQVFVVPNDDLDMVKYLCTKIISGNSATNASSCWLSDMFEYIAARGNLKILQCLIDRLQQYDQKGAHAWDPDACALAAACNNRVDVLEYLRDRHGCSERDKNLFENAIAYGSLRVIKYLHEHGCPWDANACTVAVEKGRLDVLKYLHEHGCPWDVHACIAAVKKCRPEFFICNLERIRSAILEYLHNQENHLRDMSQCA
jgi:hypothetical protein